MEKGKVLIDGDIIAYRAAFSSDSMSSSYAESKAQELIEFVLEKTTVFPIPLIDYFVYLTGQGNFRHEIAKSFPYKGNRKDKPKPKYLKQIREYLVSEHHAIVSEDEEADDLIAMEAAKNNYNVCVASVDKDMLQIPCWHFNITRGDFTKVSPEKGNKFFYTQILTGDSADNIKGLWKVGPVKASLILDGAVKEDELWGRVVKAYDGDEERVVENARLLWLRRKEGEIWLPPTERPDREQ